MEELVSLSHRLLKDYVRLKQGATLGIIVDDLSQYCGSAIREAADRMGSSSRVLDMGGWHESLLGDPQRDFSFLIGPEEDRADTILYVTHAPSHGKPYLKQLIATVQNAGLKIGGLPGCSEEVLEAGLSEENDPAFVERLFTLLQGEERYHVFSENGTDLAVTFDHSTYTFVNSNGILVPGKYGNPIPAECFGFPVDVEGTLVVDASYGALLGSDRYRGKPQELFEQLQRTPIIMTINGSRVEDVRCRDDYIQGFVRTEVFEKDPEHGPQMGEVGFPANLHVLDRSLTGKLLLDEKGRFHAAHGDGYQKRTGCPYKSDVHSDGLVGTATIVMVSSGSKLMHNNVYNPALFK